MATTEEQSALAIAECLQPQKFWWTFNDCNFKVSKTEPSILPDVMPASFVRPLILMSQSSS